MWTLSQFRIFFNSRSDLLYTRKSIKVRIPIEQNSFCGLESDLILEAPLPPPPRQQSMQHQKSANLEKN
jgi:hypothetical protein